MKRFRTLGIAATMAMSLLVVLGASSASAAIFSSPAGGQTTWQGNRVGAAHKITLSSGITCNEASFTGTTHGSTFTSISVEPTYKGCTWVGGSVVAATNGCDFRLRPGSGGSEPFVGSLDIVGCTSPMSFTGPSCKMEIGNQNGLGPVKYSTTGAGTEVTVAANFANLTYTLTGASCYAAPGTYSNGTYQGDWAVKGSNTKGEQVPIAVEGTGSPSFKVDQAPATLSGKRVGKATVFVAPKAGSLACTDHSLSGSLATTESSSLTVTPSYGSCAFLGSAPLSLSMGGCSYTISPGGSFAITGANCATEPITFSADFGTPAYECKVTIGPQAGLTGLSYVNDGWTPRGILMEGTATGLKYTTSGNYCSFPVGTYTDGTFRGTDKLLAATSGGEAQGLWIE